MPDMEDVTTQRLVVATIIGPIRVSVARELNIAASAAAAAKVHSKVGCGFEILEDTVGGSEMAGKWVGMVSAKCSDYEWNIEPSRKCCIHQ